MFDSFDNHSLNDYVQVFAVVEGWRALPKPRRLLLLPAPPRRLLITFPAPVVEILVPTILPLGPPTLSVVTQFSLPVLKDTEPSPPDSADTNSPPESAGTVSPPTSLSPPSSPLTGPDVKPLDHQIEVAPGPLTRDEGEDEDDDDDDDDDDEDDEDGATITITAADISAAAPPPPEAASPSIRQLIDAAFGPLSASSWDDDEDEDETPTTKTTTTTTTTTTTNSSAAPAVSATPPPPPPAAGPSISSLIDAAFGPLSSSAWGDEEDEPTTTPAITTSAPPPPPPPPPKPASPSIGQLIDAAFGARRSSAWDDDDDDDDDDEDDETPTATTTTAAPPADPVTPPLPESSGPSIGQLIDAAFGPSSASWGDDDDDEGLCGAPVQDPVPSAPSEHAAASSEGLDGAATASAPADEFTPPTEEELAARQAAFEEWRAFANWEGDQSFAPGFDPRYLVDTEATGTPCPRTERAVHHYNRYGVPVEYPTSTPPEVSVWAHGAYEAKAARANAGERKPLWRSLRVQLLEHLACRTVDVPGVWVSGSALTSAQTDDGQHSVVDGEVPGEDGQAGRGLDDWAQRYEEEKEVGSEEEEA